MREESFLITQPGFLMDGNKMYMGVNMKILENTTIKFNGLGRIHVSTPHSLSVTIDKVSCPKTFYDISLPDDIYQQTIAKKKKRTKK